MGNKLFQGTWSADMNQLGDIIFRREINLGSRIERHLSRKVLDDIVEKYISTAKIKGRREANRWTHDEQMWNKILLETWSTDKKSVIEAEMKGRY